MKLALRTQQVLAYETGVANVADPLAGSYYVEALTNKMEQEAEELFSQIERVGGVVNGIEAGWFQRQIAQSALRYQHEVEQRRRIVVGVNDFTDSDDTELEILKVSAEADATQRDRLRELREKRNSSTVERCLEALYGAADRDENVVPPMLDCAREYCTLYEIRNALERVYGAYREPIFF